jgi:FixJ family two-component response regulator
MSDNKPIVDAERPVVYVIDDDDSVRVALGDLLASVGLEARTFGSTEEFLNGGAANAPGCLVLDIRMPGQSGMDFQQQMADLGIRLPVIFITGHGDIGMSVRAMKEGAIEFLAKPFRDQDLLDAIQHGIDQDRMRRRDEAVMAELRDRWLTLTQGERAVMDRVVRGLLNKQIAVELHISEITVKVRRRRVLEKMQAHSLADLVRISDKITPRPSFS